MKKVTLLIVAVFLTVLMAGCAGGPQAAPTAPKPVPAQAEIVLKMGYSSPTSNPWHTSAEHYAKYVSEKTNGKVQIHLFPAEMLGPDKTMAELVAGGTLDMQIAPQGVMSAYEPKLSALGLPFLFDSNDKVAKVLDGPIGVELAKDLPSKGMRVLAYWENGFRHTTNSKKPIEKPTDLVGMKIRTPEDKMTISIFKALGANPSPMAYNELYLALSQKIFDGQENPITNIHASKFYEVQKYLSLTNHKYECKPLIISEKIWQKLTPEIQGVLAEGATIYAKENRKLFAEGDAKLLEDLKAKGMLVNSPNLAPFREATKSVYDEWVPTLGKDLIDRIIAATK